ncbi:MAG TPA: putative baseplate assembly protein, partial [Blastocatellia bacterium]
MSNSTDQSLRELNDCGCCEGVEAATPVEVKNRPGLSAIAYRVGTHSQFKQSMLAALSDSKRSILGNLKTREDDDFSIALLDAWAMVADVLAFYQERIANESYLRTATERRSVIELARAIGYELNPGVAASTYLTFTLEDALGSPKEATIDKGARAQSIPGPGEKPQVYETVEKIEAKADYNLLKPRQTELQMPGFGSRQVYIEGVANNVKPGDPLLFVGLERAVEEGPESERWDFRRVSSVELD